ncbi:MAG: FAD-dependent oxidoreductase [Clostridiales Family XIII bacterium]|jgi:2,4-dienoyl-CoA reductase-like NADH-dependent reductase (Old Yellow Enzyme family)/thioredoxin reductase|nr:FAD-dependent oxidoreductase [Clostridiales Family XIII bacterium]
MADFKQLLAPGRIGACEIPNRLVVGPMVANMNPERGLASEQYIRYHEEKAKGGWGLILTEDYRVSEHAGGYPHIAGLYSEEQVESHKRLTDRIHRYDTKIFAQIYHAGRQANSRVNGGVQPVSCSPVPCPWNKELPRALRADEIERIVEDFAHTALNVKRAGFDGVEIHAAHGYLIHQFLSLHSNKRTDAYGGCYDNRLRFLREILTAVRGAVGGDFPMQVRVSAADEADGGRGSFESHRIFRDIEACGADAVHVTFSMYGTRSSLGSVGSFYQPRGYGARYAAEVKRLVHIPVLAAGSIHDPYMADELIEKGDADFVTMARMSLCDPRLPEKLKAGRPEDIRPCVRCLQGCTASTYMGVPLHCMVNPELGHEFEYDYSPAPVKKKIFVAGGGVAGMEAARAAKRKGHAVTLFESGSALGGQFVIASYPPFKGDFAPYPAWLAAQLEKGGVEVRLNTELTPEIVSEEKPDKVIVATGARPALRPHKGIEHAKVVRAEDVLCGKADTGQSVLVVGGGMIGSETAAYLGTMCKASVALTTRQTDIGGDLEGGIRDDLKDVLNRYFVKVFTRTSLREVTEGGAVLVSKRCGPKEGEIVTEDWFYPCDTVVAAFGTEAYDPLSEKLIGNCETVVVGDARKARKAVEAVREGFVAGLNA